MNIVKGIQSRPVKAVLYGVEGIGKSTFAAQFPKPLFIDLEGGTHRLDVDRIDGIRTWQELTQTINEFITLPKNPYETLVIDTADAAARLCETHIIRSRGGIQSIEDIPYGKGYKKLSEEFSQFLVWLETVVNSGFNVVIVAHAMMRTITKPDDLGAYDHWELKLPGNGGNKLGALVKEWADLLLFMDYKTQLVTGERGKKIATGGERVMYAAHTPFADAKNRFDLPERLPMEYGQIAKCIPNRLPSIIPTAPAKASKPQTKAKKPAKPQASLALEPLENLRALMKRDSVKESMVKDAVERAVPNYKGIPMEKWDPNFIQTQLLGKWEAFKKYIDDGLPF